MNRAIQTLSLLLFLALGSLVCAQTPVTCGLLAIDGPDQVDPGTPIVFKAKVSRMPDNPEPEFRWTISLGTITKGQGTGELTVDSSGLGGLVLTATVQLLGAGQGCTDVASKTMTINNPKPPSCRFDSYGDIKFEDEQARLDNFAIQVFNNPQYRALIMMYAGQKTFQKEAEQRFERIRSYLSDVRGLEPTRIVTVDCGFSRALTTKLYVVPPGATLPTCEEGYQIPFSEVKFTKPRPKTSKKKR